MDLDLMSMMLKAMMEEKGESKNSALAFRLEITVEEDGIANSSYSSKAFKRILGEDYEEWYQKVNRLVKGIIKESTQELNDILVKHGYAEGKGKWNDEEGGIKL